ncbi:MAG: hypothetical protein PHZ19_10645 [Candidatus Thermoplasmatota archaeon]|nr:hypothetical protein [Candidatus Thermoplasmatota archaeon]
MEIKIRISNEKPSLSPLHKEMVARLDGDADLIEGLLALIKEWLPELGSDLKIL